jgi:type IV secretion system protein VirB8
MRNKKDSPKIDAAVAKSVDFEIAVGDLARRSERRAWMVAFASVIMSLILIGGYFYVLPLKEKVPYVHRDGRYRLRPELGRTAHRRCRQSAHHR